VSWYIRVEDVQDVLEDIEKKLYACGKDSSVAVVRHSFSHSKKAVWIEDYARHLVCDINLTAIDRVIHEKRS
jgi:hypothetical protein